MITYVRTPDPGSTEARRYGCTCPVEQKAGKEDDTGWPFFWVEETCPLHKPNVTRDKELLRRMVEIQRATAPR